jgi:predicted nucleotidyltransferase
LIKTRGVADLLKSTLKSYLHGVDFAFIYGSLARGEEIATSDVDLMLVGDLKLAEIAGALKRVEKSLGREVNATIYSRREFAKKMADGDVFIKTVVEAKKIMLKGSENELNSMAR